MPTTSVPTRFVALDNHRKYLVVGAVDSQQHTILTPRRFSGLCFRRVGKNHFTSSDAMVLAATAYSWLLYDQLEPLVASLTVAHPLAMKLIAATRLKTASCDTIKLARLLATILVPAYLGFPRFPCAKHYFWRAVDQDGGVLDILAQSRCTKKSA